MSVPRSEPLTVNPPREYIGPAPLPPAREELSVVGILTAFLRYRYMVLTIALLLALNAGWNSYSSPRVFLTEAQFMPRGARGMSGLQNLAQQFGFVMGGTDPGNSPQFYMDLLKSRTLLTPIAKRQYTMRTDTATVTGDIVKIYRIKGKTPAELEVKAFERVRGQIKTEYNGKTGVITMSVRAATPELAQQIARNALEELNRFNLERRRQNAVAERAFVESQLAEAQTELRRVEEQLQQFLMENRQFRSSPQLTLMYERLNRTVNMRQQIYTTLATAYEQAKIEEVRDLPVLTVIEPPPVPIVPEARGTIKNTIWGFIMGLLLGIGIAVLRERFAANRRSREQDFAEFVQLRREAIGDVTHPWRPVHRMFMARSRR